MIKDLRCNSEINRFQARINRFILLVESKF